MKALAMVLSLLLSAAVVRAAATPAGRNDGTYLHEARMVLETPHLDWLSPCAQGKPRVLFLVRRPGIDARTIVEIAQRMDVDYGAFLHTPDAKERDYWEANLAGSRTAEKEAEALNKLAQPWDAIVLIDFDVKWLPEQAQFYLARQVQGGTGLVAVHCGLPWPTQPAPQGVSAITAGVPLSGLPGFTAPDRLKALGAPRWQDLPGRLVSTGMLGQGRTAAVSFRGYGLEPEDEVYCNYHYSLLIRALQWVTPSLQPDFTWGALPEGESLPRESLPRAGLTARVNSRRAQAALLTLVTAIRNPLGDVEEQKEQSVTLQPGDNDLALALPLLPSGTHFFDMWLKSARGIEQYGSFAFSVTAPQTVAAVEFDKAFHQLGDAAAQVRVVLSGPLTQSAQVRLTGTDTYGRLVSRVTATAPAGASALQLQLPLDLVVALGQWVRADLVREGATVASQQALLIVTRRDPAEFPSLLWGGIEGGLEGLRGLRRQRETGFNIAYANPAADGSAARFAALADMQFASYAVRIGPVTDGKDATVTNDQYMTDWIGRTVADNKAGAPYGPFVYSLGDECFTGPAEQACGPRDVAAYRRYLQQQYGSLAELNRVWQTSYASFDQIQPVDWASATDPKLFPQKHERLAFINYLYADAMHRFNAGFKQMDPTARVGAEGSEPGDLEETLQGLEMWGPYSDRRYDVLLASLAPRSVVRGMWWGGYHGGTLDRPASVLHFWRQVFEGVCNTNFFFDGILGHHESNLASDLSFADYFEKMMPQLRELYETPGPLLSAATYRDQGVALLWSEPSEHAGRLWAPFGPPAAEMLAQFAALDANGVNYRFVTTRQLEAQGLDPAGVKLLLMPATTALSAKQAAALTRYVEAGGTLFADGAVGMMDEHCAMLQAGQLDGLLGLSRSGAVAPAAAAMQGTADLLGTKLTADLAGLSADQAVRAPGAKAVLARGEVPLLTVRQAGQGATVFYNGNVAGLLAKGAAGSAVAHDLVGALLHGAGVTRLLAVEPAGSARVYSHALGSLTLLSVVVQKAAAQPVITLTQPAVVYDCLRGVRLGRKAQIAVPAGTSGFELYALAGDDQAPPQLTVAKSWMRARRLPLTVTLPGGAGRLVRLDVYRPDGSWVRTYRRFLHFSGNEVAGSVPLAINDPSGTWKLRATDLATGGSAEATVTVG